MKVGRKTRAKARWEKLTPQVMAGDVSFNSAGDATVFDGEYLVVPDRLLAMLPPEIAAKVERNRQAAMIESRKRSDEFSDRIRRQEEAKNARLDEPGFTLLAGENTDVVACGTFRQCREALWKCAKYPRDSYTGKGCWVILDGDCREIEAGYFTKHGLI